MNEKQRKNERWQKIERVFDAALEVEADARADFLANACAEDVSLHKEVESLLAAHGEAGDFLASPADDVATAKLAVAMQQKQNPHPNGDSAVFNNQRLGAYQLIRELGRGGMGVVWLAERADGQFYQQVAIKLLHAGAENEEVIRRFRHERQILASLDHPNIARLLDGGTTEDGRPYFVMEYIEGLPIDEYCRHHQLSVDDRLRLFRQVCAAVHYAHQNLVIHRDLKPSNIVVTTDGTQKLPKLLDFGIAKLIQPDLSRSYDTLSGVTPMTPAYASPEQVRGEKLTTASDVYSLGVVLYELLTGRSPYRLKANTFGELMRAVVEQEPERPSTAITRADGAPPTNPTTFEPTEKLRRRLSGDIDSIVLMALRKEAPLRYGSVEQFSEDIRRYLEGLPTLARRGTLGYRALKYIRRNRVPVAAALLILISLLGGIVATRRQALIAGEAQVQAEAQAQSNRHLLYASQIKLAQSAWDNSNVERVHELLAAHIPRPGQDDLRGFEWYYLWRLSHSESATLPHSVVVTSVAFAPDGKSLITIESSPEGWRVLRCWDTSSWKEKYRINGESMGDIGLKVVFSRNGQTFITGENAPGIIIWETATGKRIRKIGESETKDNFSMAISSEGTKLAANFSDQSTIIYNAQTGQELLELKRNILVPSGGMIFCNYSQVF